MAHPDRKQLAAFGHGKLGDDESKAIADHLAGCKRCQDFLDQLPDEALLALIRPLFAQKDRPSTKRPR
jgi:hypothetical protein